MKNQTGCRKSQTFPAFLDNLNKIKEKGFA
jgi:hypothetical protein